MTAAAQWVFDRDDIRWVGPVTVTDDGTPTLAFQVTVVRAGDRPTVWRTPDTEPGGAALGARVGTGTSWPATATPGLYLIRARIVGASETESVEVGRIRTT
jgi:hypothetical protein